MEAVILIGLQGAGKTTFYQERFCSTHVRINLDTLKTRQRELDLLNACLSEKKDFVVDNTNPTIDARKRYLQPARAAGYHITGYYFDVSLQDCLKRNQGRVGKARIPAPALYRTRDLLEKPSRAEGFDALFTVWLDSEGRFIVEMLL